MYSTSQNLVDLDTKYVCMYIHTYLGISEHKCALQINFWRLSFQFTRQTSRELGTYLQSLCICVLCVSIEVTPPRVIFSEQEVQSTE